MRAQDQRKNAPGNDEWFMRLALTQAARGIGHTSPNPAVGAVIVKEGRVLAKGHHRGAGQPHAEIEALRKVKRARGATMFVTLEPCSTHGRTPPCTEAIVNAGLAGVVIGALDPNPRHAGRGVGLLRGAGIAVRAGVLGDECAGLNRGFNRWIVTGRPWVIAKAALTLDGRLALPPEGGRWLSGPSARAHAHRQRALVDAILIGANTLRTDNPRLTVRGVRGARQPWRVVLTRTCDLPPGAHLFTDEHRERTLVFGSQPLTRTLAELGAREVTSVLIEGGGQVLGEAFEGGLVDEVQLYLTPHLAGGPAMIRADRFEALDISTLQYEAMGNRDVLLKGRLRPAADGCTL